MRPRNVTAVIVSSPVMVGAITTLIVVIAVFLSYNANSGLPFVPVYRVSIEVPNAARVGDNNEVRIGGARVGVVESLDPIVSDDGEAASGETGEGELPKVGALLNLKLDKTAEPLPQDSIFRIRYRSTFGLKYIEIVRGVGPPAPEGHIFEGTDDGAICSLPTDPETFASSSSASAKNGCFQEQMEFDDVNDTYDAPTRRAQRENLVGFGSGLAGRGTSLNETIAQLGPLFRALRPVGRALADPEVDLARFFNGLSRTARFTAPAATEQGQFFDFAATALAAISSDPEKLKEAISEAPQTYETGIRLLPGQREFLGNVETFATLMRPGAEDLSITLPVLNDAVEFGAPVLEESPPVNQRLEEVFGELDELVSQPSTGVTLGRLGETFRMAQPLVRHVAPAQTVCNYWNYWFTFLPGGLSERDNVGYSLRQMLTRFPASPAAEVGLGGYSGIAANGKAGPAGGGEFRPYEIPMVNTHPYGATGQRDADCQPGQFGYPLGQLRVPGQPAFDPGNKVSDLPGSRGPTTAFWDANRERVLFDSRVPSRQPETWRNLGP